MSFIRRQKSHRQAVRAAVEAGGLFTTIRRNGPNGPVEFIGGEGAEDYVDARNRSI